MKHIVASILFAVVFTYVTTELASTEEGQGLLGAIGILLYGYIGSNAGWFHDSD